MNGELKFKILPAPSGVACTADTDLSVRSPTPCGKPAVCLWTYGGDVEEALCDDCRIKRARADALADQRSAFEEDFGYPPDYTFSDMINALGIALVRYETLLEEDTLPPILAGMRALVRRRRTWVFRWLFRRNPNTGTVMGALNSLIEAFRTEHKDAFLDDADRHQFGRGLREARRIAGDVVIRRWEAERAARD